MDDINRPSSLTANSCYTTMPSQRGGTLLMREGYRYNKKRENNNGHTIWQCVKRNVCNAVLVTSGIGAIVKEENHQCDCDMLENELKLKINECIQKAATTITPMPQLYSKTVEDLRDSGLDLIVKLPKYDSIKKTLYRKRNTSLQVKKLYYKEVRDMEVPVLYKDFLLADYGHENIRLLLFASFEGKELLNDAKHIFCDGTFKSAAPPFSQIYSLHVDVGSTAEHTNIVPAVYALLPNKTQASYEIFFNLIKSQVPKFNPELVTTDFETSAMTAVSKVFPDAKRRGCIFHFKQAIWKRAKKLGLTKSNVDKSHVRRCMALAHLPEGHRADAWQYVLAECIKKDAKTELFNKYFFNTWLSETSYFVDKWGFYGARHTTNNAIEWWNSRLNRQIKPKPNIALLLQTLKKDAKYYTSLWKNNAYIAKRTESSILQEKTIERSLRQFMDHEITIGHCIEKLKF